MSTNFKNLQLLFGRYQSEVPGLFLMKAAEPIVEAIATTNKIISK